MRSRREINYSAQNRKAGVAGRMEEVPEVRRGGWRVIGVDSDRELNQRSLRILFSF